MKYKNNLDFEFGKFYYLLFLICFLFSLNGKCQNTILSKHAIVLDLGGISAFGSLNYERLLVSKNNNILTGKIGFSIFRFRDFEREVNPDLLFPLSIQYLKRKKSHHAVLGIGQIFSSVVKTSRNFNGTVRENKLSGSIVIGYRFQKRDRPFFIQASYTPIFEFYKTWWHWGGLSLGYNFKNKKNKS